jgi:hypothetical protein
MRALAPEMPRSGAGWTYLMLAKTCRGFPRTLRAAARDDADCVAATMQHALPRGVETVSELEDGGILAEPRAA